MGTLAIRIQPQGLWILQCPLFGQIDVLINNAGVFIPKPFIEYTAEDFSALVSTTLAGFLYFSQLSAKQMLRQKGKVKRVVRFGALIAMHGDVGEHPKIADGASQLPQDVFGQDKNPSRLVYGVASLPLGTPVELELIFEVEE